MTSGREEAGVLKTGLPLRLVSRTDTDRAAEGQPGQLPAGGGLQASTASAAQLGEVTGCSRWGRQGLGSNSELASLPAPGTLGREVGRALLRQVFAK